MMKQMIVLTLIALTIIIGVSFLITNNRPSVIDQIRAFGNAPLTAIEQARREGK